MCGGGGGVVMCGGGGGVVMCGCGDFENNNITKK